MGHSHGKKRRRYERLGGHLFTLARHPEKRPFGGLAPKSLCGLTASQANSDGEECQPCEVAKQQLWA